MVAKMSVPDAVDDDALFLRFLGRRAHAPDCPYHRNPSFPPTPAGVLGQKRRLADELSPA